MLIKSSEAREIMGLSEGSAKNLFTSQVVSVEELIDKLNSMRMGCQPVLSEGWVPSRLLTIDKLAKEMESRGLSGCSVRHIANWTKRLIPAPHFRVTKRVLLFDPDQVERWISSPLRTRKRNLLRGVR